MAHHDHPPTAALPATSKCPTENRCCARDGSVQQFWHQHRELLDDAWVEWDHSANRTTPVLDDSLIDEGLRTAVARAWEDPTKESGVRELLSEGGRPASFSFQFFDPDRLGALRSYLEDVWDAGIPLRPPYGIVLNRRGGAMLDARSEGHLGRTDVPDLLPRTVGHLHASDLAPGLPRGDGLRHAGLRLLHPLSTHHRHVDPPTLRRVIGDA